MEQIAHENIKLWCMAHDYEVQLNWCGDDSQTMDAKWHQPNVLRTPNRRNWIPVAQRKTIIQQTIWLAVYGENVVWKN